MCSLESSKSCSDTRKTNSIQFRWIYRRTTYTIRTMATPKSEYSHVYIKTYAQSWILGRSVAFVDGHDINHRPTMIPGQDVWVRVPEVNEFDIQFKSSKQLVISLHIAREFMTQAIIKDNAIVFDTFWRATEKWVCQTQTSVMPTH